MNSAHDACVGSLLETQRVDTGAAIARRVTLQHPSPYYDDSYGVKLGEIVFQPMAPHCWGPPAEELFAKMTAHLERYAPAGADRRSWRY